MRYLVESKGYLAASRDWSKGYEDNKTLKKIKEENKNLKADCEVKRANLEAKDSQILEFEQKNNLLQEELKTQKQNNEELLEIIKCLKADLDEHNTRYNECEDEQLKFSILSQSMSEVQIKCDNYIKVEC